MSTNWNKKNPKVYNEIYFFQYNTIKYPENA